MNLSAFRQELDPDKLTWLRETPVFCFTSDIEWSPEWAIEETLRFFFGASAPLTPFVTHDSSAVRARYGSADLRRCVGVHPNFLPGSSHGATTQEVVAHVQTLWPEATGFRSHCFFDHTLITREFRRAGFDHDSNLGLFLQPGCEPLHHISGMTRYPVFWEDDDHFGKGVPCESTWIRPYLDRPGLKVFNTHPLMFTLNVPDEAFFQAARTLYELKEGDSWRARVHSGAGIRTFLEGVVEYAERRNYPMLYLHDLHRELTRK